MKRIFHYTNSSKLLWLLEIFLTLRATIFLGRKYYCPCCGWSLRAFTHGGKSFKVRHRGYCPRCNSKARHRRNWLYLEQKTNLFFDRLCVLHVGPKFSLSRRFKAMPNLEYLAIDILDRPNLVVNMDLTYTSITSNTIDAVLCIHVLEHIQEDILAIQELFRVLKPGGWAFISVPIQLDQVTFEDPKINTPKERELAFGEVDHVRVYGYDLRDRLEESGFQVHLDLGKDLAPQIMDKYGLLDDENIFFCTKPSRFADA